MADIFESISRGIFRTINHVSPGGRANNEANRVVEQTISNHSPETKQAQLVEFTRRLRDRNVAAMERTAGLVVSATALAGLQEKTMQANMIPDLFTNFGHLAHILPEQIAQLPTELLVVATVLGFSVGVIEDRAFRYFRGRTNQMRDSLYNENLVTGRQIPPPESLPK